LLLPSSPFFVEHVGSEEGGREGGREGDGESFRGTNTPTTFTTTALTSTQPEIEREERAAIQGMFEYAAKQGWMKGGSS